MRDFNYLSIIKDCLTLPVTNLISAIHENKGKQALYIESKASVLSSMLDIAKIQSTSSSNRIEGIFTSDSRLKEIVMNKTSPKSRSEKEIAGYRDVLTTIHENHDYITPTPNYILQLHRDLYKYSGASYAGKFKDNDNLIEERDIDGSALLRFRPVAAFETKDALEKLCSAFSASGRNNEIDPLLLIPVFIFDFLCIHPFNDGNGRMSRLLTLLLLYRAGYIVGKYISIEMIIEKTKETYYDVLKECSFGWHEASNNYRPFLEYYLGVILNGYKEFSTKAEYIINRKLKVSERVEEIIKNKVGRITKNEIVTICPDISVGSIERALTNLIKGNVILKLGGGRFTTYVYNYDNRE